MPLRVLNTGGFAGILSDGLTPLIDHHLARVKQWMNECQWFQVYDIVEAVHENLTRQDKHQGGIPVEGGRAHELLSGRLMPIL
jgi:hypothetical protein